MVQDIFRVMLLSQDFVLSLSESMHQPQCTSRNVFAGYSCLELLPCLLHIFYLL